MDLQDAPVARRRRGAELEEALLEATWAELSEHGYGALTIDAVAQRAGTSRPVVYRRWAAKPELVLAAVVHVARRDAMAIPDTGSLREDMLAVLRRSNAKRIGFTALLTFYLGGYFQETGTSPADLDQLVPGGVQECRLELCAAAAAGDRLILKIHLRILSRRPILGQKTQSRI